MNEKNEKNEMNLQEKQEKIKTIPIYTLKYLYENAANIKGISLVGELEDITRKIEVTDEIYKILKQIVAKRVAADYIGFGHTRLDTMSKIVPLEDMLQNEFLDEVGKECSIMSYDKKDNYKYNKGTLKKQIEEKLEIIGKTNDISKKKEDVLKNIMEILEDLPLEKLWIVEGIIEERCKKNEKDDLEKDNKIIDDRVVDDKVIDYQVIDDKNR